MTKPLAALAAALTLTGASACGGDEPATGRDLSREEAAVERVAEDWITALAAGDGKTACALLTDKARAQMNTLLRSCEESVAEVGELMPADLADAYAEIEVTGVHLHGDQATIEPEDFDIPEELHPPVADPPTTAVLRRVDGAWKLDAAS